MEHAHAFGAHPGRQDLYRKAQRAFPIRRAGLELAILRGWIEPHESGTFVKFTEFPATMTSTLRPTSSLTKAGNRSIFEFAARTSTAMFWPSTYPSSRSP